MTVYNRFFRDFETLYMAYVPLSIIFQSCLGSVAAMSVLLNQGNYFVWQLGACTLVTMFYNAAILAQLRHRVVFNSLIISVMVNVFLIIINF